MLNLVFMELENNLRYTTIRNFYNNFYYNYIMIVKTAFYFNNLR